MDYQAGSRVETLAASRVILAIPFTLLRDMDIRFVRLEAKIDAKPGAGTIYQAALGMFTGMFAVIIGTVIVLKTTGFIP